MKARLFAETTLAAILAATTVASASDQKSILENVAASDNHTILLTAVKESGLAATLDAKGTMTFFAPTDEAFKKLGVEQIKKLVADKELLRKMLLAHLVVGIELKAEELKKLDGKELNGFRVSTTDGLKIGGAKVISRNRECGNGIIHGIDTVLIPWK
jgi:uncharacterized surface protein with fasciclin (FAS1) repeats